MRRKVMDLCLFNTGFPAIGRFWSRLGKMGGFLVEHSLQLFDRRDCSMIGRPRPLKNA
jgi:hypothetical protein